MAEMAIGKLRPGRYAVAVGDELIGLVRGDYGSAFEAIPVGREQPLGRTFTSPEEAGRALLDLWLANELAVFAEEMQEWVTISSERGMV